MRDILSQGGRRQPSRWPRRLLPLALLALVAVVIAQHRPHHRNTPAGPRRSVITAGPVPLGGPGPPRLGRALPHEPDGISGRTLPWARSLRLPVTGERPAWFWPATGRRELIRGLPREKAGYQFTRAGAGWAVQPAPAPQPGCPSCAARQLPVYFLGDRAPSVTRVGAAQEAAPAAAAGAIWLTSYPPGADKVTAAGTAQEVSAAGRPLRPPVRLPAGFGIDQATDGGLLLAPVIPRPGVAAFLLWDPATARPGRAFTGVIAASAAWLAWTPRCDPLCRVHVLDLAAGKDTVLRLPAGSSAASGAFSPDGRFLALQVSFGAGGDGGALAAQLEVVAPAGGGRLRAAPGTWASSDALAGFGWAAGSDTLVTKLSFTSRAQVTSWRPGAGRLAVADVRPAQALASLVVG